MLRDIETVEMAGLVAPLVPSVRFASVAGAECTPDIFVPNVEDKLEAVGAVLETIFAWGIRSAEGKGGR